MDSVIFKKASMFEMISAIESDLISNIYEKLKYDNIPSSLIDRANIDKEEKSDFLAVLRGLDFQGYIEICNLNIQELAITLDQKRFLNADFKQIIQIRNNVMHPRLLGMFDYPILKEIFENVEIKLNCFTWKNVKIAAEKITNKPNELRLPPRSIRKSDHIIENLPVGVDFEETSFIGRRREIGEIKEKLSKKHVHILSIIGDGGVGKTAIALKLLYDMLDDTQCPYELIIWVSLKTSEFNGYEFTEIRDSINTTAKMYEKLRPFVGALSKESIPNYIIELARSFNTLLVLDNLETINTSEIKEFLDSFTEHGKVIITSRIGLGEIEHRYKLSGLSKDDALEYMNALLDLYGFPGMFADEEKIHFAEDEFHSNPLAIKWFVKCLHNGLTVEEILKNKHNLIIYCMSNVYDKLSIQALDVLDILLISGIELTIAELMYYMDCTLDNYTVISYAINELIKCNFIDDIKYKLENKLQITQMAREFLKLKLVDTKHKVGGFKEKEKILSGFRQQLLQKKSDDPYGATTFLFINNEMSRVVSAFHLTRAIQFVKSGGDRDDAIKIVDFAKRLTPHYSECYTAAAFIYGTTSFSKADDEFQYAFDYCVTDDERAITHILYASLLLRNMDYESALKQLQKADNYQPDNVYTKLEMIKVMVCINLFPQAEAVLKNIDYSSLTENYKNIYLTRLADYLRRKAEQYGPTEISVAYSTLEEAFSSLEKSPNPDRLIFDYMARILRSMCYIDTDESYDFILEKLRAYHSQLKSQPKFRDFMEVMSSRLSRINDGDKKKQICRYLINETDYLDRINSNEGIVYAIKDTFGFFKTKEYPTGVYFKKTLQNSGIEIGDIIRYDKIVKQFKGCIAPHILIVGNVYERFIDK